MPEPLTPEREAEIREAVGNVSESAGAGTWQRMLADVFADNARLREQVADDAAVRFGLEQHVDVQERSIVRLRALVRERDAEQLVDDTGDPRDEGYNQAVDDVVSALTTLRDTAAEAGAPAPAAGRVEFAVRRPGADLLPVRDRAEAVARLTRIPGGRLLQRTVRHSPWTDVEAGESGA